MQDEKSFAELMRTGMATLPQQEYTTTSHRTSTSLLPPFIQSEFSDRDRISNSPIEYCRNGVSDKVFRKLRRDPIDNTLDLHGMTVEQAHAALDAFLSNSLNKHQRVVEIIHGRGLHSSDGGKLQHQTRHWLQHCSAVMAYCTPHQNSGSALVLLKNNASSA